MRPGIKGWLGLAAAAGLAALLLAVGTGRNPSDSTGGGAASEPAAAGPAPAPDSAAAPALQAAQAQSEARSALAVAARPLPSHEGTLIDGGITLDANGEVIPDLGLRRLFDYFLTGIGRDDPAGLRARLAAALSSRELPESARQQVLALFDRYLGYRAATGSLTAPSGSADSLRAAFEARYALRREILGPEIAEGFFGREEAEDRFVMETRALAERTDLPEWERRQRLALLEQQLPEDIRRAREQSRIAVTLAERTEQLQTAGADQSEIRRMREELVGPAAADRLAELDRQRERWQQRLDAYRRERDRILAAEGLSESDRQAALDTLRRARFDEQEAVRVRALDHIDGGG